MGVAGRVVLLMMGDGWVRGSARMMRSADAFEGGLMCRGSADALEGALIFSRGCDRRFDVDPTRISKCAVLRTLSRGVSVWPLNSQ
mmetsp:Transcript_55985/g.131228  ORF Transcript_55985/g.131228 Transcript_55985/m.131228 type:complete len:86 (+) Transcript_55985:705-962(+)